MKQLMGVLCFSTLFFSCYSEKAPNSVSSFMAPISIPPSFVNVIDANKAAFLSELNHVVRLDTDNLLILVDKTHLLPLGFVPENLCAVGSGRSYIANKSGLSLRSNVEASLEKMASSARADGITLLVSSTYRSYSYQKTVYERNVREMGQLVADRESAKPGTSQHQLGSVVDFGSITDDFARTEPGKWLSSHAADYGWSLSFPDGYESVTGYRWECWHYRYMGKEAVAFQKKWFGDVQQYMLEYIAAWKKYEEKR